MANFDRISSSYDFLKRLVFGRQIQKATNYFLDQIPLNCNVLIVGGGTGEILETFKSSQQIKYLELSAAMILRAKKVNSEASIEFVQADILDWATSEKYDYVITPFILDCFNDNELDVIIPKLKNTLNKEGCWIQTDFYPKNRLHNLLIEIMYAFFNLSTNLKTKKLADFDSLFEKNKFICLRKALFYHSMMESKIYQKIE